MVLLSPDVEPLWIARYDYEPGWHLPSHVHADYFQMLFIAGGTGHALLGADRARFAAGQLLFVRPRLKHGLEADAASTVRTLDTKFYVRRAEFREACRKLDSFHANVDPRVVPLIEALHT